MKLAEITKDEFKQRLTDPGKTEIEDMIEKFNAWTNVSCGIEWYSPELVEFHVKIDEEHKSAQREVIKAIAQEIERSNYWRWDTTDTPGNSNVWVTYVKAAK